MHDGAATAASLYMYSPRAPTALAPSLRSRSRAR